MYTFVLISFSGNNSNSCDVKVWDENLLSKTNFNLPYGIPRHDSAKEGRANSNQAVETWKQTLADCCCSRNSNISTEPDTARKRVYSSFRSKRKRRSRVNRERRSTLASRPHPSCRSARSWAGLETTSTWPSNHRTLANYAAGDPIPPSASYRAQSYHSPPKPILLESSTFFWWFGFETK